MSVHWLADQVAALTKLSEHYRVEQQRQQTGEDISPAHESSARTAFLFALRKLVEQVNQRPGVSGCFVAYEGFTVEAAGKGVDYDALAAMTQSSLMPAEHAAETLSLGAVQQLVIVGSEQKLALIQLGQMTLGILSPASVQLSEVLKA